MDGSCLSEHERTFLLAPYMYVHGTYRKYRHVCVSQASQCVVSTFDSTLVINPLLVFNYLIGLICLHECVRVTRETRQNCK